MIYIVTFEIHRDCQIQSWVFHCTARNAKEACATARQEWTTRKHKGHQFAIHAVRSRAQGADLLNVKTWRGEVKGADVLDRFLETDFYAWRVDGRNLYGCIR